MDFLKPIDAERAVVGILAGGRRLKDDLELRREDFFSEDLGRVFSACQRLNARPDGITLAALDEELTRECGAGRASELMQTVMSAEREYRLQGWTLSRAAGAVREGAQRRALARIGEAIARGAQDDQRKLAELIDSARTHLNQSARCRGGWIQAADACLAAYEAAERREKPIATGIPPLDSILCGGLHRGELTILGARPAVGKSAVLLQVALNAARAGMHVCFASLEMSASQIGARILAASSGVNAAIIRAGQEIRPEDWTKMADGLVLAGADCGDRLALLVHGGMTVEELRAEVHGLAERGACDLLIIDYLQLLRTQQRTGSDFERIGVVSRGLKALTLDLGVPVLAAAQVRRQNNGGVLRAPSLDELRGSGDIEQDADNVILMHRSDGSDVPGRYGAVAQMKDDALISFDVAKQRQGMTARAWSVFQPAQMRFIDPGVVGP